MPKKITLRFLAKELSISPATVLRGLSGHPGVRPDVRKKVIAAARKYKYRLPSHNTGNIAIVTPGMTFSGYLGLLLRYLCDELLDSGFTPYIISETKIERINEYLFDGIISTTWNPGLEHRFPKIHSLPLISVNTLDNRLDNVYMVGSDELNGFTLGLDYLFHAGCRRILFLTTSTPDYTLCRSERIEAFRAFCEVHHLPCEDFIVRINSENTMEMIVERAQRIHADAIFIASEGYALELYSILQKHHIRIPDDISVMGMEIDTESRYMVPALTTLRQNYEGLSHAVLQMLKQRIAEKKIKSNIRIPYQLIERDSVKHNAG